MATSASVARKKAKTPQELLFKWEGKDRRGVKVTGELRGLSTQMVRAEIRRQGITPLKVTKKAKPLFDQGGSVGPKDIMLFTRQLHTMLTAGIPIVQAIDMVAQSNGKKVKLQKLLTTIKNDVESGTSLALALEKHHYYFNELYCNLVNAGEQAGVLESILDKLATYLEKLEGIKSKIKKALIYPAVVLTIAFGVTAFILAFVIPVFEELFDSFGASLPAFTEFVVSASHFVRDYWWLMFGGLAGSIVGLIQMRKRSPSFARTLDKWMLKIPVFGPIGHLSATSRFSRTLATMFDSGVPLVEALTSVAGATGNAIYEKAVLQMREGVSIGQQLNFTMRQSNLFNQMVIQMVAIGEDTGSLGAMLAKVADFYEEELDEIIAALTSLIEPIVIVILGVLVGGLVVAMYLPIFKIALTV